MKDSFTKDRFVLLRVQGKSFSSIAEELGVSKPTLIAWSREMRNKIANLRAIDDEAMRERFQLTQERRLKILSGQLEVIEEELEKRSLADISTDKLYGLLSRLLSELRQENEPLIFRDTESTMLDLEKEMTWEG